MEYMFYFILILYKVYVQSPGMLHDFNYTVFRINQFWYKVSLY